MDIKTIRVMNYYLQVCAQKLSNYSQMHQVSPCLAIMHLFQEPKFTQEEIDIPNKPISFKETEPIITNLALTITNLTCLGHITSASLTGQQALVML